MSGARIIKLGAPNVAPQSASFEEAFGDYSNAQGRGRERRKARKLDRIENRTEVKTARRDARAARKSNRIDERQGVRAERIAGRTELQQARKAKRLSKREMGTESRLARRTARADVRAYKRGLRNPQEELEQTTVGAAEIQDTNTNAGQDYAYEQPTPGDAGSLGQGAPQGGFYGGEEEGGYYGEEAGGYYGEEDGGYYPEEEIGGYYGEESDDIYDQSLVDETAQNAYDLGYQDAQEDAGLDVEITGDEDYGDFDGIMGAEDRYNELQDKNDMPVNPQVQSIADKCVWNEMLIAKLKNDRKNASGNPQQISKTILERAKRMKDLKSELEDYANYCGNYSSADGTNEMIAQRKRIVQVAMNKARRKASGQAPVTLTSVPRNLKPQVSANRIVVPSSETMSSATGTGIDALDDINDFDAPETREFFIPADGGFTKGIDLGSIALGALITVGFIYFNNKYKWIKM
jgi:hypothetical protein